jgi:hypothetical protein
MNLPYSDPSKWNIHTKKDIDCIDDKHLRIKYNLHEMSTHSLNLKRRIFESQTQLKKIHIET